MEKTRSKVSDAPRHHRTKTFLIVLSVLGSGAAEGFKWMQMHELVTPFPVTALASKLFLQNNQGILTTAIFVRSRKETIREVRFTSVERPLALAL